MHQTAICVLPQQLQKVCVCLKRAATVPIYFSDLQATYAAENCSHFLLHSILNIQPAHIFYEDFSRTVNTEERKGKAKERDVTTV